jgi:hypothetical protein
MISSLGGFGTEVGATNKVGIVVAQPRTVGRTPHTSERRTLPSLHRIMRAYRSSLVTMLAFVPGCLLADACRTHTRQDNALLTGCFHRVYGDAPPPGRSGSVHYFLVSDSGATTMLEIDQALLDRAGGAMGLDRTRVAVRAASVRSTARATSGDGPPSASAQSRERTARVLEFVGPASGARTRC